MHAWSTNYDDNIKVTSIYDKLIHQCQTIKLFVNKFYRTNYRKRIFWFLVYIMPFIPRAQGPRRFVPWFMQQLYSFNNTLQQSPSWIFPRFICSSRFHRRANETTNRHDLSYFTYDYRSSPSNDLEKFATVIYEK